MVASTGYRQVQDGSSLVTQVCGSRIAAFGPDLMTGAVSYFGTNSTSASPARSHGYDFVYGSRTSICCQRVEAKTKPSPSSTLLGAVTETTKHNSSWRFSR